MQQTTQIQPYKPGFTINNPEILAFLAAFPKEEWDERLLKAIEIGIKAMRIAGNFQGLNQITEKYNQTKREIDSSLERFSEELNIKLLKYIGDMTEQTQEDNTEEIEGDQDSGVKSGELGVIKEKYFGAEGVLTKLINNYFDSDKGIVIKLLKKEFGENSEFKNKFDPENEKGVVIEIYTKVEEVVNQNMESLSEKLSLENEESPLSLIRNHLKVELGKIKDDLEKTFMYIVDLTGLKDLINDTNKKMITNPDNDGVAFEDLIENHVSNWCAQIDLECNDVKNIAGDIPKNKFGQLLITYQADDGDKKIVIESRSSLLPEFHASKRENKHIDLPEGINTLNQAKANRKADIGIFIFEEEYCPGDCQHIRILNNDLFVSISQEDVRKQEVPFFLDIALKIALVTISTPQRIEGAHGLDIESIEENIKQIYTRVLNFADLEGIANKIRKHALSIHNDLQKLEEEITDQLNSILKNVKSHLNLNDIPVKETKKQTKK